MKTEFKCIRFGLRVAGVVRDGRVYTDNGPPELVQADPQPFVCTTCNSVGEKATSLSD